MSDTPEQTETEAPAVPEGPVIPKGMSPDEYKSILANFTGVSDATDEEVDEASESDESEEELEEGQEQEEEELAEEEEEEVVDEEEQPQPKPKAKPTKGGVAFTLPDGTKVTHKEAREGYLRTRDYTNKTMTLADERKKLERFKSVIDFFETNPDEVEHYIERMKGKGKEIAAQPAQKLTVPEHYKQDQYVVELTEKLNRIQEQIEQKADVGAIKAASTQQQKQVELGVKINTKLNEAYSYIADKLGRQPNPQEYEDKIKAALIDKQMSPEDLASYILGPDPDYMKGFVERVYQDEIGKAKKGKTTASGGKAKESPEKRAVLKASGKSGVSTAGFQVPKDRDGNVDSHALSRADPGLQALLRGQKQ